jgi:hypothetical protein
MKKRFAGILTGVAVLIVVLGIVYSVAVAVSAVKLHRAYAELAAAGRPMRVADIIPPCVSDEENGALLYQSATLLLKAQPIPRREPDQREKHLLGYLDKLSRAFLDDRIDPNGLADLQRLLRHDAFLQAMSIVRQGTQRPACQFERVYNTNFTMGPPHVDIIALGRVLAAKARLDADAGRVAEAWEVATLQLRFADALRQDPVTVSQWVRSAMIRSSCKTLHNLCVKSMPDEQQQRTLTESFEVLDDISPIVRAIDGERLLAGERLFAMSKGELYKALQNEQFSGHMPDIYYRMLYHRTTFRPTFLADHAAYLRAMHMTSSLLEKPYSLDDVREDVSGEHRITLMLAPPMYRAKQDYLGMVASVRITLAGLAVLQHRQTHGAFPPAIDNLGLRSIVDPFAEQPLHYRASGERFILYSVGKDQKDNGGSPKQPKQTTDFDIVWQFPGPVQP